MGLVLALMGHDVSILFFVAAYLLRPAMREFGLATRSTDERELVIHSRSGNIAFVVVILAAAGLALWRLARGQRPEELCTLVGIGLGARAIAGLVLGGEYRKAGAVILGSIGLFLGLFIILETGFSWASLAGVATALLFAGVAMLALRAPRWVAAILAVIVVATILKFDLWEFRSAQTARFGSRGWRKMRSLTAFPVPGGTSGRCSQGAAEPTSTRMVTSSRPPCRRISRSKDGLSPRAPSSSSTPRVGWLQPGIEGWIGPKNGRG
jgi:MFS family permease